MKFLIIQLRPEDKASDNEFEAFLSKSELKPDEVERIRMEKSGIPDISARDYAGIIIGGGASNVSDPEEKKPDFQRKFEADLQLLLDEIYTYDVPFFGACYGFGALVQHQKGIVSKEKYSEPVGVTKLKRTNEGKVDPLIQNLPDNFDAFCGHKEACQLLPPSAVNLLTSDTCPIQMFKIKKNIYAAQFHPELDTEGIIVRINTYKHAGYFPPEQATTLIKEVEKEKVFIPSMILKNFAELYRK